MQNKGEHEEDSEEQGLRRLLYTDKDIERGLAIWGEFRQERKAQRERDGEREKRNRDEEWGISKFEYESQSVKASKVSYVSS